MSGELWKVCGLMVIALVSGYQEVWVQALAGDIAVFWDTTLYSHSASLSTQVYKYANLMLGVTLQWTSIPSRGGRNTSCLFMAQEPG